MVSGCSDTNVCFGLLCLASLCLACKRRLSDWKQIWGTGGACPSSLDLMTHFLSSLVPQAVKRQSRCPEVPYHGTERGGGRRAGRGGRTEYTCCRDSVSNRERHTPATRRQIKGHFPSRKLTSTHHSLQPHLQSIPSYSWLSADILHVLPQGTGCSSVKTTHCGMHLLPEQWCLPNVNIGLKM